MNKVEKRARKKALHSRPLRKGKTTRAQAPRPYLLGLRRRMVRGWKVHKKGPATQRRGEANTARQKMLAQIRRLFGGGGE